MKRGFTLLELIITCVMLAILAKACAYVLRPVFVTWTAELEKTQITTEVQRTIETMVRDLRESKAVNCINNSEIRFTKDNNLYNAYYFYSENDSSSPPFTQNLCQLKETQISGGHNGTFTYGAGKVIINNVAAPPVSSLFLKDGVTIVDLSVRKKDSKIRVKTSVKPRNL